MTTPYVGSSLVSLSRVHETQHALVLIPAAGSGVAPFKTWKTVLDGVASIYAVRLPGRESRLSEAAPTTIEAAAREVARALEQLEERSVVLLGHCSGALTAFEVAQLDQQSRETRLTALVVASQRAPSGPIFERGLDLMDNPTFLRYLQIAADIPTVVWENEELMKLLIPQIKSDFEAVDRYSPNTKRRKLAIPIIGLAGSDDSDCPIELMESWRSETTGTFRTETFVGGHSFIFDQADAAANTIRLAFMSS